MTEQKERQDDERWHALRQLEDMLDLPMAILGLIWLTIIILEFTRGIDGTLQAISIGIWIVFLADFALRLFLAPNRVDYLKHNWLTAIALVIPAFRIARLARALRALRAARGLRLVRLVSSLNRGMGALGRSMGRRGAGYVVALTILVVLGGAAGMLAFEQLPDGGGLESYGDALWFTAMIITTLGSQYWPQTVEGRVLAVLLSLYSLGILGYVTAALASFFVERDAVSDTSRTGADVQALRNEIAALRAELRAARPDAPPL